VGMDESGCGSLEAASRKTQDARRKVQGVGDGSMNQAKTSRVAGKLDGR
jgi:hypothetical protein